MFKMLIGITFLTVIADVLLTDSSYKKYIKSIIGIFTLAIIVQGIFSLEDIKIDYSVIDTIEKQVEDNMYILEEDIKNEMINNLKRDITSGLLKYDIKITEISINCDENLNIVNMVIRLKNKADKEKTIRILTEEFHISETVIDI